LTLPMAPPSFRVMLRGGADFDALLGARIDRRRLLIGGASSVALLGLGALLPAGCRSYPKPEADLLVFNAMEYAILNAAAARLLGVPAKVGPDASQVDVAANIDRLVSTWDAEAQRQLRTMLRLFEHGTYLFDLQRKRFTRLSGEQQDLYLRGWMNSTLGIRRAVFRAIKALVALGFYQDPRVWRRLGYDGPWLGRVYVAPRTAAEPGLSPAPLAAIRR
jgi:hypothetical protein